MYMRKNSPRKDNNDINETIAATSCMENIQIHPVPPHVSHVAHHPSTPALGAPSIHILPFPLQFEQTYPPSCGKERPKISIRRKTDSPIIIQRLISILSPSKYYWQLHIKVALMLENQTYRNQSFRSCLPLIFLMKTILKDEFFV